MVLITKKWCIYHSIFLLSFIQDSYISGPTQLLAHFRRLWRLFVLSQCFLFDKYLCNWFERQSYQFLHVEWNQIKIQRQNR